MRQPFGRRISSGDAAVFKSLQAVAAEPQAAVAILCDGGDLSRDAGFSAKIPEPVVVQPAEAIVGSYPERAGVIARDDVHHAAGQSCAAEELCEAPVAHADQAAAGR